jgi:hypothetical protein
MIVILSAVGAALCALSRANLAPRTGAIPTHSTENNFPRIA